MESPPTQRARWAKYVCGANPGRQWADGTCLSDQSSSRHGFPPNFLRWQQYKTLRRRRRRRRRRPHLTEFRPLVFGGWSWPGCRLSRRRQRRRRRLSLDCLLPPLPPPPPPPLRSRLRSLLLSDLNHDSTTTMMTLMASLSLNGNFPPSSYRARKKSLYGVARMLQAS